MQIRALKKVITVHIRAEKPLNLIRSPTYQALIVGACSKRFARLAPNNTQRKDRIPLEKAVGRNRPETSVAC